MKRRSATSSPPEPVFFSDENLGRRVFPDLLRAEGISLKVHLDHFEQGTPDDQWVPAVAARGWVLLTLDARLRYNRLEQDAIREHGLAVFVLVSGKSHEEKATNFLRALPRIRRLLLRQAPPFIAKVLANGEVRLWLTG